MHSFTRTPHYSLFCMTSFCVLLGWDCPESMCKHAHTRSSGPFFRDQKSKSGGCTLHNVQLHSRLWASEERTSPECVPSFGETASGGVSCTPTRCTFSVYTPMPPLIHRELLDACSLHDMCLGQWQPFPCGLAQPGGDSKSFAGLTTSHFLAGRDYLFV